MDSLVSWSIRQQHINKRLLGNSGDPRAYFKDFHCSFSNVGYKMMGRSFSRSAQGKSDGLIKP